jgi:hypothetical protein
MTLPSETSAGGGTSRRVVNETGRTLYQVEGNRVLTPTGVLLGTVENGVVRTATGVTVARNGDAGLLYCLTR